MAGREAIESLSTGPEGQRARAAETPEGAYRRSRGVSPVFRGVARDGAIIYRKETYSRRKTRHCGNSGDSDATKKARKITPTRTKAKK